MSDFKTWFDRAVNDETFQSLDPQNQQRVIWGLMDKDEKLQPLNDEQRFRFLGGYVEATMPQEPEEPKVPTSPTIGAYEVNELPILRQAESFVRTLAGRTIPRTIEGLPPMIREFGKQTEEYLKGGGIDVDLSSDVEAAEGMVERSLQPIGEWLEKEINQLEPIKKTSGHRAWAAVKGDLDQGILKNIVDVGDWVAGGAADSAAFMTPAAALTAVTGAPVWAGMVPTFTGMQAEEFRKEGVEASDLELVLSGVTQSVLGAKFGAESLIGAAPNSFVKNIFSTGFRRGLWRMAGGMGGELTTEIAQEYVNQQLPKWSKGDQQFWMGLDPEEQREILEGGILASVLQIPVSFVGAVESGAMESIIENAKKRQEALARIRNLTPEEQGAAGYVQTPRAVRPLTEDQINQIFTNYAEGLDFLTDDQRTAFVKGELDMGQFPDEQRAMIDEAYKGAKLEIGPQEDVSVEPVAPEQQTVEQDEGLQAIRDIALIEQQNMVEQGNEEGAAQIQEALDTLEIVDAKSTALRTVKGVVESLGARVDFFRATNGEMLGSNGVSVGTDGRIMVRWDATAPQMVAGVALHEAIHVLGKRNFDALKSMYDSLHTARPEYMAEVENRIRTRAAELGQTLDDVDMVHEATAYVAQWKSQEIYRALQAATQNLDVKSPGPIKSVLKSIWDTTRAVARKVPGVKDAFPYLDEEFDIKRREANTRLINQFAQMLQTGQREAIDIQPDNFGRRGRKKVSIEGVEAPAPRTPTIEEDTEVVPREPTILEDKGKRAGKRQLTDIGEVAPPEPRGEALITEEEPAVEEETREATQEKLLETPSKPAEVRVGPTPREVVQEPREPQILLDEPMIRTTAAKLEVGDQLEVDNEVVTVTKAEAKGGKRVIHYVNNDGDVSRVTVSGGKRFMKFENPQEEALAGPQKNLFEEGRTAEQLEAQRSLFEEEDELAEKAAGQYSLNITPVSVDPTADEDLTAEEREDHLYKHGMILEVMSGWEVDSAPGTRAYVISNDYGPAGYILTRERYKNSSYWADRDGVQRDREVYVEYVEAVFDKKGDLITDMKKRYTSMGVRQVAAARDIFSEMYPDALWIGGYRVGGVRAEKGWKGKDAYTRIPLYSKSRRKEGDVPSWWTTDDDIYQEGVLSQDVLLDRHGVFETTGYTDEQYIGMLGDLDPLPDTEYELSEAELRSELGLDEDSVRQAYDDITTTNVLDSGEVETKVHDVFDVEEETESERARIDAMRHIRAQDDVMYSLHSKDPDADKTSAMLKAVNAELQQVINFLSKEDKLTEEAKSLFEALGMDTEGTKPIVKIDELPEGTDQLEEVQKIFKALGMDSFYSFTGIEDSDKLVSEYTTEDWNALGKKHGVKNLGGMGKMVEIYPGVEIPGGLDGTFTYEEILWLKHQAIDVYNLPRDIHRDLHHKIVRTMQPDPKDTLQVLNHFIFSMLSPNQPLTPNELSYAVVRVRNDEESKEWAKRVPWDTTKGESGNAESFLKYDADNEEAIRFIKAAYKSAETDRRKRLKIKAKPQTRSIEWLMENRPGGHGFDKWYRNYYNSKISREFNLQAKESGGMGLLGTAEMTNIAELNQFYQSDPDWFLKQNMDGGPESPTSWHTYVERLGSQFRGMATKVASFAAVWQDPLGAAISAVDRHMGRIYEPVLFPTPQERLEWEMKVIKDWNKSKAAKKEGRIKARVEEGEIKNFDELFMRPGGDGHFVKAIMDKMKPGTAVYLTKKGEKNHKLPEHWKNFEGKWLGPEKDITIQKMSEAYKDALLVNAKRAQELNMGLFATQWFEWDRYRRRLEPHEINFPGLYKLPHLSKREINFAKEQHSAAGYLAGTKEKVPVLDSKGRPTESVDIRLKPVKTAPLGSLNYYSFSEGPGHFPPGRGFRTPLYNLHQAQPLSGLDPESGPAWGLPDQTWKSWLINKFQDKFYRVKQLQTEIEKRYGNIHEDMDAYLHEMLYHGKAADQVEAFEREYVNPLLDALHEGNFNIEEFENWLHARHAEERNAHLDDVWYNRKKKRWEKEISNIENQIEYAESRDYDTTILKRRLYRRKKDLANLKPNIQHSGMTNEQAEGVLKEAGNKFDGVARLFDNMMDQKLKILHEAGLITDQQLENVSIYEHYVPLKGKEFKGDLEEILEDANIHTGQGFDIRGDELGFSFGRVGDTKHTRPVLAQAVVDIEEAIVRAEKNRVGQAFLELVQEFPNENLYKVNSVTRRRVWDRSTGTVRLVKDAFANNEDNVVAVKKDGKTHYIEIFDSRLSTAMKNLGSGPMHSAVRIFAAVNRFMAAANTTYNPEFVIANLLRDVQTAGFNMTAEDLKHVRNETLLNVPKAINAIRKAEGLTFKEDAEVAADEWVKYYNEYVADGGKIGFFGYTDVVTKARSIQRKVERAGNSKVYNTFSYAQKVGDLVSSANSSVENAARLSVYVASRKAGVSRKKAAAIGRNLTVNFNKKGDAGQALNAFYLFANASIQGTARMMSAVLNPKNKSLQKLVGAQIMASWALAAFNRGIGGEDEEDGYPWWEKIGDWQKERSLIVMMPEGEGQHIKIPLPYGYNVFHVVGTQLEAMLHAVLSGTSTVEGTAKGAANLFNAIMTAFNPLGGASLDSKWEAVRWLVPSAFAPIADTFVNETYYGAPIAPVRSSWDHSPDSQRYFKSVNPIARELTAFVNRWTGGNEYESGWIDQNPETLEYLVGAYTGAGAKTGARLFTDAKWLKDVMTGGDLSKYEANDIVFLRRIYGEVADYTAAAVFYENIEGLEQGEKAYKNLEGDQLADWKEDNGWMVPLFKKLTDAQKGIRETDDPDAKNRIRKGFNKSYREAWLSQFD